MRRSIIAHVQPLQMRQMRKDVTQVGTGVVTDVVGRGVAGDVERLEVAQSAQQRRQDLQTFGGHVVVLNAETPQCLQKRNITLLFVNLDTAMYTCMLIINYYIFYTCTVFQTFCYSASSWSNSKIRRT